MVISHLEKSSSKKMQLQLSPTLQKAASVTKKRDLQQYLEEEKRRQQSRNNKSKTSILRTTKNTPSHHHQHQQEDAQVGGMDIKEFTNPFIMIEDSEYRYAAAYKEYEGGDGNIIKYPIFYWNSAPGHSPFILPTNPTFPINRPVPLAELSCPGMTTRSKAARKSTPSFRRPTYSVTTNKPRPGFCECCWEKFSDLDQHVTTGKHRIYARNSEHYLNLDLLLEQYKRPELLNARRLPALKEPISPAKSFAASKEEEKCSVSRGYTESKRRKQMEASQALFEKAASIPGIYSSPSVKRQRKNNSSIKRRLFV